MAATHEACPDYAKGGSNSQSGGHRAKSSAAALPRRRTGLADASICKAQPRLDLWRSAEPDIRDDDLRYACMTK